MLLATRQARPASPMALLLGHHRRTGWPPCAGRSLPMANFADRWPCLAHLALPAVSPPTATPPAPPTRRCWDAYRCRARPPMSIDARLRRLDAGLAGACRCQRAVTLRHTAITLAGGVSFLELAGLVGRPSARGAGLVCQAGPAGSKRRLAEIDPLMPALREGCAARTGFPFFKEDTMLQKFSRLPGRFRGLVVVIVMDGYGIPSPMWVAPSPPPASRPRQAVRQYPNISLRAHGTAVGMPSDDDMGNLRSATTPSAPARYSPGRGAGRRRHRRRRDLGKGEAGSRSSPGKKAVGRGDPFHRPLLRRQRAQPHRPPEGDGRPAKEEGVRTVRIHALLDGRDVPETSALDYVVPFEAFLAELSTGGFSMPRSPPAAAARTSPWTATTPTGRWSRRAGRPHRAGRGPTSSPTPPGGQRPARQNPAPSTRISPSSSSPTGRQAGRHHRGRRRGGVLQFPRRPRHRDHPRLSRRRTSTSSTACARAEGHLRRHAASTTAT